MRYKVKLIREEEQMAKQRKSESKLRDLIDIMPILRKHNVDAEIHSKIKTLRAGRTQKTYTLELSRIAPVRPEKIETRMGTINISVKDLLTGISKTMEIETVVYRKMIKEEFKAAAPISNKILKAEQGKVELLRKLKTDILNKVREARKVNKPIEEEHTFREGIQVRKLAEIYLDKGTFYKLDQKRIRNNMTKSKIPFNKEHHVGVEIEIASKEDIHTICDKLFEAGLGKHIQAKRDGSIVVDTSYPHQVELAIIAKQTEIAEVIKKVCDVLNNKCHVRVDKSCGLHVHLDMRSRKVETCFSNLILMQRYLYSMVPANRKLSRRDGGYSQTFETTELNNQADHYYGINSTTYNKFQTLEIRMHCGTTQPRKINNFISFLLSIVEAEKITTIPESMDVVASTFKLSEGLRKYIESRIAKFATQHRKIPNPKWMGETQVECEADEVENEASEVA